MPFNARRKSVVCLFYFLSYILTSKRCKSSLVNGDWGNPIIPWCASISKIELIHSSAWFMRGVRCGHTFDWCGKLVFLHARAHIAFIWFLIDVPNATRRWIDGHLAWAHVWVMCSCELWNFFHRFFTCSNRVSYNFIYSSIDCSENEREKTKSAVKKRIKITNKNAHTKSITHLKRCTRCVRRHENERKKMLKKTPYARYGDPTIHDTHNWTQ